MQMQVEKGVRVLKTVSGDVIKIPSFCAPVFFPTTKVTQGSEVMYKRDVQIAHLSLVHISSPVNGFERLMTLEEYKQLNK